MGNMLLFSILYSRKWKKEALKIDFSNSTFSLQLCVWRIIQCWVITWDKPNYFMILFYSAYRDNFILKRIYYLRLNSLSSPWQFLLFWMESSIRFFYIGDKKIWWVFSNLLYMLMFSCWLLWLFNIFETNR